MGRRVGLKTTFPPDREFDFFLWYLFLFDDAMRDDGDGASVKEVEHAIIYTLKSDAQLVDVVSEIVGRA